MISLQDIFQIVWCMINEQKKAQSQRRAALQEFVPFEAADLRERKENSIMYKKQK